MEEIKEDYIPLFELNISEEIIEKKSFTLIDLFYELEYLQYRNNNSLYGTLNKPLFYIPIGTPIKMVLRSNNIIDLYYIDKSNYVHTFMEFIFKC